MPTKAALSEAEYLRTSFPGVDQEYRDGELVERSVPDLFHGVIQSRFSAWFINREDSHGLHPATEVRNYIRPGRFMIPDVCVFWPSLPSAAVPETKPLIVIEILSPDDSMTEVMEKLSEYKEWGIVHVWLADPRRKKLYVYHNGLYEVSAFPIPEAGIELPSSEIFR